MARHNWIFLFFATVSIAALVPIINPGESALDPCNVNELNATIIPQNEFNYLQFSFSSGSPDLMAVLGKEDSIGGFMCTTNCSAIIYCGSPFAGNYSIVVLGKNTQTVNYTVSLFQDSVVPTVLVPNSVPIPYQSNWTGLPNTFPTNVDLYIVNISSTFPQKYAEIEIQLTNVSPTNAISTVYSNLNTIAGPGCSIGLANLDGTNSSYEFVVVNHCSYAYGQWIIALAHNPAISGNVSYEIAAVVSSPTIVTINTTRNNVNNPNAPTLLPPLTSVNQTQYFQFVLSANNQEYLNVTAYDVQSGSVVIYLSADFPFEPCQDFTFQTCQTSYACSVVIEPCGLPNASVTWYLGVRAVKQDSPIIPITFAVSVSLVQSTVVPKELNDEVSSVLYPGEYQIWYVDTTSIPSVGWLDVHLYASANIPSGAITLYAGTASNLINGIVGPLPCYASESFCSATANNGEAPRCTLSFTACQMQQEDEWYFGVWLDASVLADAANSRFGLPYTLTKAAPLIENWAATFVANNLFGAGELVAGQYQHYFLSLQSGLSGFLKVFAAKPDDVFRVFLKNQTFGVAEGPNLAGDYCGSDGCYSYIESGSANPSFSTVVSGCCYSSSYYISVQGTNPVSSRYSITFTAQPPPYSVTAKLPSSDVPTFQQVLPGQSANYTLYNWVSSSSSLYLYFLSTQLSDGDVITFTLQGGTYQPISLYCASCSWMLGSCSLNSSSDSCTIVLQPCEITGQNGNYLLITAPSTNKQSYSVGMGWKMVPPELNSLRYGVTVPTTSFAGVYDFYALEVAETGNTLLLELYVNAVEGLSVSIYFGLTNKVGAAPCYNSLQQETTNASAVILLNACENFDQNAYFVSVIGNTDNVVDTFSYTLTANSFSSVAPLDSQAPLSFSLVPFQTVYHTFQYNPLRPPPGDELPLAEVLISSIQEGSLDFSVARGLYNPLLDCPCYNAVEELSSQGQSNVFISIPCSLLGVLQIDDSFTIQVTAGNTPVQYVASLRYISPIPVTFNVTAGPILQTISIIQYSLITVDWQALGLSNNGGKVQVQLSNVAGGNIQSFLLAGPPAVSLVCTGSLTICSTTPQSPSGCTGYVSSCDFTPQYIVIKGIDYTSSSQEISFTLNLTYIPPVEMVLNGNAVTVSAEPYEPSSYQVLYCVLSGNNDTVPVFQVHVSNPSLEALSIAVGSQPCFLPQAFQSCSEADCVYNAPAPNCDNSGMLNTTWYVGIIYANASSTNNATVSASLINILSGIKDAPANPAGDPYIVDPASFLSFQFNVLIPAPGTNNATYMLYVDFDVSLISTSVYLQPGIATASSSCALVSCSGNCGPIIINSCCLKNGTTYYLVFANNDVAAPSNITNLSVNLQIESTITPIQWNVAQTGSIPGPGQIAEYSADITKGTVAVDIVLAWESNTTQYNVFWEMNGLAGDPAFGSTTKGNNCYTNFGGFTCEASPCHLGFSQCSNSTFAGSIPGQLYVAITTAVGTDAGFNVTFAQEAVNDIPFNSSKSYAPQVQDMYSVMYFQATSPVDVLSTIQIDSSLGTCNVIAAPGNSVCVSDRIVIQCGTPIDTCQYDGEYLVVVTVPPNVGTFNISSIVTQIQPTALSSDIANNTVNPADPAPVYYSFNIPEGIAANSLLTVHFSLLATANVSTTTSLLDVSWSYENKPFCFSSSFPICSNGTLQCEWTISGCQLMSGDTLVLQVQPQPEITEISAYSVGFVNYTVQTLVLPSVVEHTLNNVEYYSISIDRSMLAPNQDFSIILTQECGTSSLYVYKDYIPSYICGNTPAEDGVFTITACDLWDPKSFGTYYIAVVPVAPIGVGAPIRFSLETTAVGPSGYFDTLFVGETKTGSLGAIYSVAIDGPGMIAGQFVVKGVAVIPGQTISLSLGIGQLPYPICGKFSQYKCSDAPTCQFVLDCTTLNLGNESPAVLYVYADSANSTAISVYYADASYVVPMAPGLFFSGVVSEGTPVYYVAPVINPSSVPNTHVTIVLEASANVTMAIQSIGAPPFPDICAGSSKCNGNCFLTVEWCEIDNEQFFITLVTPYLQESYKISYTVTVQTPVVALAPNNTVCVYLSEETQYFYGLAKTGTNTYFISITVTASTDNDANSNVLVYYSMDTPLASAKCNDGSFTVSSGESFTAFLPCSNVNTVRIAMATDAGSGSAQIVWNQFNITPYPLQLSTPVSSASVTPQFKENTYFFSFTVIDTQQPVNAHLSVWVSIADVTLSVSGSGLPPVVDSVACGNNEILSCNGPCALDLGCIQDILPQQTFYALVTVGAATNPFSINAGYWFFHTANPIPLDPTSGVAATYTFSSAQEANVTDLHLAWFSFDTQNPDYPMDVTITASSPGAAATVWVSSVPEGPGSGPECAIVSSDAPVIGTQSLVVQGCYLSANATVYIFVKVFPQSLCSPSTVTVQAVLNSIPIPSLVTVGEIGGGAGSTSTFSLSLGESVFFSLGPVRDLDDDDTLLYLQLTGSNSDTAEATYILNNSANPICGDSDFPIDSFGVFLTPFCGDLASNSMVFLQVTGVNAGSAFSPQAQSLFEFSYIATKWQVLGLTQIQITEPSTSFYKVSLTPNSGQLFSFESIMGRAQIAIYGDEPCIGSEILLSMDCYGSCSIPFSQQYQKVEANELHIVVYFYGGSAKISWASGAALCSPVTAPICNDLKFQTYTAYNQTNMANTAMDLYTSLVQAFKCAGPSCNNVVCANDLSNSCLDALRAFACDAVFPNCNILGYRQLMCSDLCTNVQTLCGITFVEAQLYQYNCELNFYGICTNIVPITPTPQPTVNPVPGNSGDSGLSAWAITFITLASVLAFIVIVGTVAAAGVYFYRKHQRTKYQSI